MQQLKFAGMDGIDEVTISSIHVKVGQDVKKGDNVFDIEADKASDTIVSPYNGKVSKINCKSGDTIKTGDIVIEFDGDDAKVAAPSSKVKPTNNNETKVKVQQSSTSISQPVNPNEIKVTEGSSNFKATGPVLATPIARNIAYDLGVDITTIKGTGPNGRVLRIDIENAKNSFHSQTTANYPSVSVTGSQNINVAKIESFGPIKHIPLTPIRKAVANAMVTSKYTAPHVSLMLDVDATNLINLRATLKEEVIKPENGVIKLTFMPFFIKAVAKALAEDRFELINSTFNLNDNEILVKKYYNIGMAVDTDKGLMVPVIKNADKLKIFEIAKEVNQLADKARKGTLSAAEMQGGTFTITNFGSAGLKIGTPIINYPEVAILGIGMLESKAVLVSDTIVFHNFFPLSISIDHRVIDGAPAGYFMQRVKFLLENPSLLILS
ncbi:MAG: dihydrolipoamide acetyltransferase family protein [Spiroplasma sp.]